jgi:phosphatidylglycerophosphate synthase
VNYTLEEVRVAAKREMFRAGPRMRFVMPRISVRVTRWILNRDLAVTPNQITAVSAALGIAAGLLLLMPRSVLAVVAAFFVYQVHILTDYVDGELARVRELASTTGAYFDLMVGRLTKPVVLYSAAVGSYFMHRNASGAAFDLFLGALIVAGFLLDKEAVDVWYRVNAGRADIEDTYTVNSERALKGPKRLVTRIFVGLRSIPAFLIYQIIASVAVALGADHLGTVAGYDVTPQGLILIWYAVTFPGLALARGMYIVRTGHIPRRQDLVRALDPEEQPEEREAHVGAS